MADSNVLKLNLCKSSTLKLDYVYDSARKDKNKNRIFKLQKQDEEEFVTVWNEFRSIFSPSYLLRVYFISVSFILTVFVASSDP